MKKHIKIVVVLLMVSMFLTTYAFASEIITHDEYPSHSEDTADETETPARTGNNSVSDDAITNQIESIDGSLIDVINTFSLDEKSSIETTQSITNLVNKIKTASGAKIVLNAMPETIETLILEKNTLENLDDQEILDKEIVSLMEATERLVALIDQPKEAINSVQQIIPAFGHYYDSINKSSITSKQIMNSAIKMSNIAIETAGTVRLNWQTVTINNSRVYLSPQKSDVLSAAKNAAETEGLMESLLNEHITTGLENAIVGTLTLKIPADLETATKTGVEVTKDTLAITQEYKIKRLKFNLGAVDFNLSDQFIDRNTQESLEFNVQRYTPLLERDKDSLPEGLSTIGAPILDLSAMQNNTSNDAFNHPVDFTIHLSQFDYTPLDEDEMVVHRFNELTGQWEPVGGQYDAATNTITIKRMHLSKYTVLKSEKNYSNIEDTWAKNEIAALKGKGIIKEDALFKGSDNVTREEFAGWIATAYGLDIESSSTELNDLDPDSPYYNAIVSAYDQGIISGNANGSFNPKGEVTKEEMAVMIASAMNKYEHPVNTSSFELAQYEEDLPTWAVNSVETVIENGIVDETFFGSANTVTKDEAAAILYQVYR